MPTSTASADRLRRMRWIVRNRVARHPIFVPLARLTDPQAREWRIAPHKAICIDGYPRTATTFAVAAFQLAQSRPVPAAHHSHAPGQLMAAIRWQIPSILTIREPEACVLSTALYLPYLTLAAALRSYIDFYSALLPYRDGVVLGDFTEVTSRFDRVIRRVNNRFGTAFAEYQPTPGNDRLVFAIIEHGDEGSPANPQVTTYFSGESSLEQLRTVLRHEHGVRLEDGASVSESTVARPSSARDQQKDALRRAYRRPDMATLRSRAECVYREMLGEDARPRAAPAAVSGRGTTATGSDGAP